MTASAFLYKYNGVDYILQDSTSGACYGPPEPHICPWTNATGSNGNGAGYYAVEGGHGVYHGNTLTFPSYVEFTVF
jgi:hypothetical protein